MATQKNEFVSDLLAAWSGGDQDALNDLISVVYEEIRGIARRHLRRTPQPTLESAAVANEAYVRLFRARGLQCESRQMFLALCAQVVRRIIGEYARSRRYAKRGGSPVHVSLDEVDPGTPDRSVDLLALDEALEFLSRVDPRKGRLLELRCFGGLTVDESADVLRISPETAKRDWKMAKAWLRLHLTGETAPHT